MAKGKLIPLTEAERAAQCCLCGRLPREGSAPYPRDYDTVDGRLPICPVCARQCEEEYRARMEASQDG